MLYKEFITTLNIYNNGRVGNNAYRLSSNAYIIIGTVKKLLSIK